MRSRPSAAKASDDRRRRRAAYVDWLLPIYAEHERPGGTPAKPDRNDPQFRRFVEASRCGTGRWPRPWPPQRNGLAHRSPSA